MLYIQIKSCVYSGQFPTNRREHYCVYYMCIGTEKVSPEMSKIASDWIRILTANIPEAEWLFGEKHFKFGLEISGRT